MTKHNGLGAKGQVKTMTGVFCPDSAGKFVLTQQVIMTGNTRKYWKYWKYQGLTTFRSAGRELNTRLNVKELGGVVRVT